MEVGSIDWTFLLPAILTGGFFVLLAAVSYYEKRLVNPYIEVDPANPDPAAPPHRCLSHYVIHMSEGAMAAGFQFGSMLAQRKYPKIKIAGAVWISKDRRTLMYSGSGTVFGMPAQQTWLVTLCQDGTRLVTTDQNDEGDASGLDRMKRVVNVSFDRLLAAHVKRLAADHSTILWRPGRPIDLLAESAAEKNRYMLECGMARPRDAEGQFWSYSFRSSLGAVVRFFKLFAGSIPQAFRVMSQPIASPKLDIVAGPLVARWSSSAQVGNRA